MSKALYIKPAMKVSALTDDCLMDNNSLSSTRPTNLGDQPGNGGESDGTHEPGAKFNIWDNEE